MRWPALTRVPKDASEAVPSKPAAVKPSAVRKELSTPKGWRPLAERRYECQWQYTARADGPIWALSLIRTVHGKELVAVTCGSTVRILRITRAPTPELVQTINADGDDIFALCWAHLQTDDDAAATLLLAAAGAKGVVRLVDVAAGRHYTDLIGHGDAILSLATYHKQPSIVASSSRDHSVRLWDAKRRVCLAVFGGHRAHAQPVTSVTFKCPTRAEAGTVDLLVSVGLDQCVRMWDVHEATTSKRGPAIIQIPVYGTQRIHDNYIDDVHVIGDALLTRSCDNTLKLWEAVPRQGHSADGYVRILRNFDLGPQVEGTPIDWWMKCHTSANILACGNMIGELLVWDIVAPLPMSSCGTSETPPVALPPPSGAGASPLRAVACEGSGRYIVCANNRGQIWLYCDEV